MTTAERDSRRPYQDPAYPNWRNLVNIPAELEAIKPHGDFVLVRVLPEEEMHSSLIYLPQRSAGMRETNNKPRVGEVVAVGSGDRLIYWSCSYYKCGSPDGYPAFNAYSTGRQPKCPNCGRRMDIQGLGPEKRCEMHVKPGDKVLYWRVMANTVEIEKEVFQFIHEEQHVLAVLEAEHGESPTS